MKLGWVATAKALDNTVENICIYKQITVNNYLLVKSSEIKISF